MRVKFTIRGKHPYLMYVRDLFIRNGLELVATEEEATFVLVGGEEVITSITANKVILLSSDAVYSDRGRDLVVVDKDRVMKEDDPIIIMSPHARQARKQAVLALNEAICLTKPHTTHTMVLRTFPVYGPDFKSVVSNLIQQAKDKKALSLYHPGYQVRTFLHQEDFDLQILAVLRRFLEGISGIYNIGSDEVVSMNRLADSIWQLMHGTDEETPVAKIKTPSDYRWWVIPDLTRTKALTKWSSTVSLRRGLWKMIQ